jgi:hypothetical protein
VVPIALFGAVWIVVHASTGRAGAHTLFQVLALAEGTIALLLRGRKPVGALASIVLVYALADLAAVILAAALGAWVRAHRHPVIAPAAGPGGMAAAA